MKEKSKLKRNQSKRQGKEVPGMKRESEKAKRSGKKSQRSKK